MKDFDVKDWSADGKKPSKESQSFDGNISNYDNWSDVCVITFFSCKCNSGTIFKIVETNQKRIDWMSTANTRNPELPHVNWQWISQHLWNVRGNYLTDTLMNKRTDMTMGEEFNGLELWGRSSMSTAEAWPRWARPSEGSSSNFLNVQGPLNGDHICMGMG